MANQAPVEAAEAAGAPCGLETMHSAPCPRVGPDGPTVGALPGLTSGVGLADGSGPGLGGQAGAFSDPPKGLGLETTSDPRPQVTQRPNASRPGTGPITGYKWVRRGCLDPRLGFPATTREVRRLAHSARSIQICPPPPPLLQSFAAVVMGDRRADKRPMEVSDPEAERRRERELRDKAKRVMRHRSGGREAREERGGSRDQGGREGDWGPPPPWWIQQQERKKKNKVLQRRRALERKHEPHPSCGGGHGDPKAMKPRAAPLAVALPSAPKGTTEEPIPVEVAPDVECFKCGRPGHFQSQCKFLPLCVLCKEEGHASAHCPTRGRQLHLQIMGSAISGEGFFCLEFEDVDETEAPIDARIKNAAILSAEPGNLNLRILEQELKHMVTGDWDWQVTQVGDDDFVVVFPSADLLHMAKSSGKLFLSINDITARVRDMLHEEVQPMVMPETWVRLHGIPKKHRREDRIREGFRMLGRPIMVDELSLIRLGPVRMKLACKTPEKLNGVVEVWFNHEGYQIKVERETLPKRGGERAVLGAGPANPPDKAANPGARTLGNDKHGRAEPGIEPHGCEGGPSGAVNQDTKMQDRGEDQDDSIQDTSIDTETWDKLGALSAETGAMGVATQDTAVSGPPLARSLELTFNEYGSNLGSSQVAATLTGAGGVSSAVPPSLPTSSSPVAVGADYGGVVSEPADNTPAPRRGSNSGGRQPKKTAGRKPANKQAMVVAEAESSDLGGELGAALGTTGTINKARRTKAIPVVQRAPSVRAKAKLGDLSSLESAKLRIADKNMDAAGNPLPSFRILNAFSDEHLVSILDDCGVETRGSQSEIVSLVHAREEAQAALAAAAVRCASNNELAIVPVEAGDERVPDEVTLAREAGVLPSNGRATARKRVAKAVTSRGVRLRNRVI